MSDKGSDDAGEEPAPFVEGNHETRMTFDTGGFPFYVALAWVGLIIAYVSYMYVYGLDDFTKWGMP
jgi:hypothetical protein